MTPQPTQRIELIQTAIEFLLNPRVCEYSVAERTKFLKERGLTDEEITAAVTAAEQATKEKLSKWPTTLKNNSLFGLSFQSTLLKGVVAVGVVFSACFALRHHILRAANQWIDDLPVMRELRETKAIMQKMQQTQRDYCSRVEQLMASNAAEIAQLRAETIQKERLNKQEVDRMLQRCQEIEEAQKAQMDQLHGVLKDQILTSRLERHHERRDMFHPRQIGVRSVATGSMETTHLPNGTSIDLQCSPLSSLTGDNPLPDEHQDRPNLAVFGSVIIQAKHGDESSPDLMEDIQRSGSIPRMWLTSRPGMEYSIADSTLQEPNELEVVQEMPDRDEQTHAQTNKLNGQDTSLDDHPSS